MMEQTLLILGGESTRPGSEKVSEDVEAIRVLPILQLKL